MLLRLLLWAAATLLLPTQQVYGGPAQGGSYLWLRAFGLEARPWWGLASLAAFCASLAYLLAAGQWMTGARAGGSAGCWLLGVRLLLAPPLPLSMPQPDESRSRHPSQLP